MATKYIFVTGGVCSSLGKGIASASIGALLKSAGLKVFTQKLDPYLNVDPGTMSPFQHGEVFVTDDGAETDLDLGHYERFIDVPVSKLSTVTTGKIYLEVLEKERKGDFLGGTIQIVPHITNAIKDKIKTAAKKHKADIMLVEIGGTVGDIEGLPYLEAIRQLRHELGKQNTLFVHLTLLPYLEGSGELKTKPTQASVRELRSIGIQPDIILLRADRKITKDIPKKIALFCDVEEKAVIPAQTLDSIYKVPLAFQKYNLAEQIAEKLKLKDLKLNLTDWQQIETKLNQEKEPLKIGIVGKYTNLEDAYLSVIESLKIACYHSNRDLDLVWIDSEKIENNDPKHLKLLHSVKGILVPGGFGRRGIEGKINAATYARENNIPYFGICLGMQLMTIEFLRHVKNDPQITSEEFDEDQKLDKSKYAIHFLPGQHKDKEKGGTLRLGAYKCDLTPGTKTYKLYGNKKQISERHRHRYEFNNKYKATLENNGMKISGFYKDANLVEIVEIEDHPFMVGCQFHPEFLSRPAKPHPLFFGFIQASL